MTKSRKFFIAGTCVSVLAFGMLVAWRVRSEPSTEFRFPEQVVKTALSPNGSFVASVVFDPNSKSHFFAVQAPEGTKLIVAQRIDPSPGYHSPMFMLSWPDEATARVEVDWDFGEGKFVYEFSTKTLRFGKKL